ncbi:MAG: TonB-dependent receptor [Opitutaceae bacterium]|nr:TonB-dependent receptor [Opitutaceae bacterium]
MNLTDLLTIRDAGRRGLPTWAVACLLLVTGLTAQTNPERVDDEETVTLEKFTVTGSLIPIAADTPAIPVSVISALDIRQSGVAGDLLQVLKKTEPFFYGANNIGSENGNIGSGASIGGSAVALRNRATLVLINGRRAAVSPVTASGGATFVDVSLIPVSAVERIEVLSDGASATYGSDAVSGVVNVILKTNYRGAEIGGRYGFSPNDGDYAERSYHGVFGAGTDKTQITLSTEWKRSDPLIQKDRPFSTPVFVSPTFAGSVNIGNDFYLLNPSLNAPPANLNLTPSELVVQGIYQGPMGQGDIQNFFDVSQYPTMLIDAQRRSIVAAIDHRFTDTISLFGDYIFTTTRTKSVLNAQPLALAAAATNPNNPFNGTVIARNRLLPFPRIFDTENFAQRGVVGAKGALNEKWAFEAAANFNRTVTKLRTFNLIDAAAYTAAINNLTFNPFARTQAPGVVESFVGVSFRDYVSELIGFDLRVTGELLDLPGGPLTAAFGADTRREALDFKNDRFDSAGGWLGATPRQPYAATSTTDGFFAEFRVPVFDRANAISGFHRLELSIAARKELYNLTTDPFVPKYSLRWLPFSDEFALRGTVSESFSAPTLFSLTGPVAVGFSAQTNIFRFDYNGNPLNVQTGPRQYRTQSGSNPNLRPSESRNWTAGVVWSPAGKLRGLELSVDWFEVDERDLIGNIPVGIIINSVEQLGPASPYASQVRFGVSQAGETYFGTGTPVTTPGQMSDRASDSVWITNQFTNIAGVWQSGADLKVGYSHDTGSWGALSGRLSLIYLNEYFIQTLPTSAPFDFAGSYSGTSLYPRWRAFLNLGWRYKGWTVGLNGSFVPGLDDVASPGTPRVASYRAFDARVGYDFGGSANRWLAGLSLNLGVNNAFNKFPPFIASEADQQADINSYDPIGRFLYVEANYKF